MGTSTLSGRSAVPRFVEGLPLPLLAFAVVTLGVLLALRRLD